MKPVPVYIVYFSAAALIDGKIVDYNDLYKRDAKAIAALIDEGWRRALAKPRSRPSRPTRGRGETRKEKPRRPAVTTAFRPAIAETQPSLSA